jgi:hypothetical protein
VFSQLLKKKIKNMKSTVFALADYLFGVFGAGKKLERGLCRGGLLGLSSVRSGVAGAGTHSHLGCISSLGATPGAWHLSSALVRQTRLCLVETARALGPPLHPG